MSALGGFPETFCGCDCVPASADAVRETVAESPQPEDVSAGCSCAVTRGCRVGVPGYSQAELETDSEVVLHFAFAVEVGRSRRVRGETTKETTRVFAGRRRREVANESRDSTREMGKAKLCTKCGKVANVVRCQERSRALDHIHEMIERRRGNT
jgi:hypothetical protein